MRRILILLIAVLALSAPAFAQDSHFYSTATASTSALLLAQPYDWSQKLCINGLPYCAPMSAVRDFVTSYAQENFNLSPTVPGCTQTTFYPRILHLENSGTDAAPVWRVVAEVRDNCGTVIRDEHTATTAVTGNALVTTLNAPGTYANSLFKRILLHLQSEGKIGAGSVTGSPQ